MIKKIDILGISLDNYTVREAIMQVETYLGNNVLNSIESISMQMLIASERDEILREVMSSLDLTIIGEKAIMQAAGIGTMQRLKETEKNDFFFEFFKRMERNKKSIFLLGETDEKVEQMKQKLIEEYPKLDFAGDYAVENCVGDLEAVINDMNVLAPDIIVSILPTPMQEHFFRDHKDKMNASIWYGIGELGIPGKNRCVKNFFQNIIHRGKLKNSMDKYLNEVTENKSENEA